MGQQTFKALILFSSLFAHTLAVADGVPTDSCYENSGSYQVIECFNKKIETAKIDLDKQRKLFVDKNNNILNNDKRFKKEEYNINKKWLSFANNDCKMQSFHSGEKDSIIYQVVYSECMLNMYIERKNSLKNSLKLIEG